MERRLYRSRASRMLWGVCDGLANYFAIDPTIIRVIAVLTVFLNGLGILAYIVLAIVVPLEESKAAEPRDTIKENIEEMKETATELGREVRSTFASKEGGSEEADRVHRTRRNVFGIILIVLGAIFLLASFNLFWWFNWGNLWPLILVAVGLLILFVARRK